MRRLIMMLFFTICIIKNYAQSTISSDTAYFIKEYNKVMSQFLQPHLYCKTVTKFNAYPILAVTDTISSVGFYYKNLGELYYGNALDETYLQDSFYVNINHLHKNIWINKAIMADKLSKNLLPLNDKQLQKLFLSNFTIVRVKANEFLNELIIESKDNSDSLIANKSKINISYNSKYEIQQFKFSNSIRMLLTSEMVSYINQDEVDMQKAIENINGNKYINRQQEIIVSFLEFTNAKEKMAVMPKLSDKFLISSNREEINPKNGLNEYEVTKSF